MQRITKDEAKEMFEEYIDSKSLRELGLPTDNSEIFKEIDPDGFENEFDNYLYDITDQYIIEGYNDDEYCSNCDENLRDCECE